MEPQARRDKELISKCVHGLGLYAAELAQKDPDTPQIDDMRGLVDRLVGYWCLDDNNSATHPEDFMRSFDEQIEFAKFGMDVDILNYKEATVYGLYRYGEDMVVSQGDSAIGEILSINVLMREIASSWDFDSHVLDDLTARLKTEVLDMVKTVTLPGQSMSGESIHNYEIKQLILFDNDQGFALAENPGAVSSFVTWQFSQQDNGVRDYFCVRYTDFENNARLDYILRVNDYMEIYKVQEKPLPTVVETLDMEVAATSELMKINPKTKTAGNEKQSVMEQIRAARQAPKPPSKPKPEREKKAQGPEL